MRKEILILICIAVLSCEARWSFWRSRFENKFRRISNNIGRRTIEKIADTVTSNDDIVHKIARRDFIKKSGYEVERTWNRLCSFVPEHGIPWFAVAGGVPAMRGRQVLPVPASANKIVKYSFFRSKESIKTTFPWIKNPKAVSAGQRIACDGKIYLSDLTELAESIKLPRRVYRLAVKFADKTLDGVYKLRLDQLWRGIEVYDSGIVVNQRNTGYLEKDSLDGTFLSNIDRYIRSPNPKLTKREAKRIAIQTNGDGYNNVRKIRISIAVTVQQGKPTLTYIVNYLADNPTNTPSSTNCRRAMTADDCRQQNTYNEQQQTAADQNRIFTEGDVLKTFSDFETSQKLDIVDRLVCRQSDSNQNEDISTVKLDDTPLKRPFTFIDANNGTVYQKWDGLAHSYSQQDLIAGNPSSNISTYKMFVETDSSKTNCFYQFPLGGNKYIRLNDRADVSRTVKKQFKCSSAQSITYDQTNGEMSPRNSAYIWSYYTMLFLRRLGDKLQRNVNVEVHHGGIHSFWTGSAMEFGDGSGNIFPLTTPDIVAHEVAHQFTESYSQLEYRQQSGAINEAFSDITSVAFMDHQFNIQDFKVGHLTNNNKIPFRDICSPKSTETLTHSSDEPMREHVNEWTTADDVHRAGGIYSKAFCLLSKTNGWTIQLAYRTFFDANRYYWGKQETFNSGACGVRKAANDLFGGNPQAVRDVDEAFVQVGVRCSEI